MVHEQKAETAGAQARSSRGAREKRDATKFPALFAQWARRVRGRLILREALTGVAVGLAIALLAAVLAWRTHHEDLRRYAVGGGVVGLVAGLASARRKRWSDTDVALYLDERLATAETIATAVEHADPDDEARAVVVSSAANALANGNPKRVRPPLWKPVHALTPLATAGLVWVARAPLPAAPGHTDPPGTARIQISHVEGLEKLATIRQLSARDDAQRERLDKIAKDADKLRAELATGMEKRVAQDQIARLRDALTQERLSLGEGQQRAGLESAVSKLEESDVTKRAGKALGDHDLQTMDQEMERIANEREKADRELAKKKLDEAAEGARKSGAKDVAKALEDQKKGLEEREKRANALRDLADAMKGTGEASSELQSESEALDREKSDKAAMKLADSMGKALEKLTPEERQRLADKLKSLARSKGTTMADADQMKDLADQLSTAEGQQKLEQQLKDMAKEDAETEESKRQQGIDDAEDGADGAEGNIGERGAEGQDQGRTGTPIPGEGPQRGGAGGHGDRQGPGQGHNQGGSPGHGKRDEGTGGHDGRTRSVDAHTMKSRVGGPIHKGEAMPGAVTTLVPGRAGGTANMRGTDDLKVVGPSEVDGVERSDVPEEYREHVRQYFRP